MKKKILYVLLGTILILVICAVTLSIVYKKEVKNYITEAANKKLNARFSFGDASISFIKSFPRLGIEIDSIQIIGLNEFKEDTLAIIPKTTIQISITKFLFDDIIDIKKIKIADAQIHLKVLKNGLYNWDIVKTDSLALKDTSAGKMQVNIQHYELNNSNIVYNDQLRDVYTELIKVTHTGSGDFSKDVFTLETSTNAEKFSLSYLGKPYLSEVKATLEAPLQMNFSKMEFAFKNNDLLLNQLPIHFDASFAMPDTNIDMDIRFDAAKSPLKDFLSLVPVLYQNSFKDLTASGKFGLSGYIKGRMNDFQMPGFGFKLSIDNGSFKYASIPAGIKDLYLNLNIDNKDGIIDHTIVDLGKLQLRLNNQFLQGSLFLKNPSSNPYLKANAIGDLNLEALLKIIPQKSLDLTGHIKMNIALDGNIKDFKAGKGYAKGNFEISSMKYTNKDIKKEVRIPNGSFTITPQKLLVNSFSSTIGNSDFNIKGGLTNYLMYFIKNDNLTGNIALQSNSIDLNELMSLTSNSDTTKKSSFDLPTNLTITANAIINEIKYKDLIIQNAKGSMEFAEQKINFNKLGFNLLDAAFALNGSFTKKEKQEPFADMSISIKNIDINKAYKSFHLVQKFAPIAESIQGDMNVNFSISTKLSNDLSPYLNTVNSDGDLYLKNASLNGSEVLQKIATLVKWEQLRSLTVKEAHLSYFIQNGQFIIKPFDINTNLTKMTISGKSGLDKSIQYTIDLDLPKQLMELKGSNELNKELAKLNPNLNLEKIAKAIKVQVLVTGNMQNPNLKLGLKNANSNNENPAAPFVEEVKEVVKTVIKQEVNTKLDQAQKEAHAIIQEAKIASDRIRKEAYEKADILVEDTKNPIAKIGVKLAADRIKKEADAKANEIIEKADLKAKEIINKAKNQP